MLHPTKHDPKVSCTIVCSDYMRATGFFYRTHGETYLVTARHNALPTNYEIENPVTGGVLWYVHSSDYLPNIDVYLRDGTDWERKQANIENKIGDEIVSDPTMDVLFVSVHFDPELYGYTVFSSDSVALPADDRDEVSTVGYPTDAFPNGEDVTHERYEEELTTPYRLESKNGSGTLRNVYEGLSNIIGVSHTGNLRDSLDGMSGAPVLGDGLIGVHSGTDRVTLPVENSDSDEATRFFSFNVAPIEEILEVPKGVSP